MYLAAYNAKCDPSQRLPVLCTFIDNFAELRDPSYADILDDLEKIIRDGRAYGLSFVLTASQGDAIPYKILSLIEQRLCLYLTERNEYQLILGRSSAHELNGIPGRGVAGSPPLLFQFTLPEKGVRQDDPAPDSSLLDSVAAAMQAECAKAEYNLPKPIKTLPNRVNLSTILNERSRREPTAPTYGTHHYPHWHACLIPGNPLA